MVARLTPDQKVACSIHVGFNFFRKRVIFRCLFLLMGQDLGQRNQTRPVVSVQPVTTVQTHVHRVFDMFCLFLLMGQIRTIKIKPGPKCQSDELEMLTTPV